MKEIWKQIKGYEGLYEISNLGRVKRLKTSFLDSMGRRVCRKEEIKNGIRSGTSYLHVKLFKNGIYTTANIHRLVAEAFIPNPQNLPCVNHKDESRNNNRVDNLEWCTYGYNNTYGTTCKRRNASRAFYKKIGVTKKSVLKRETERRKKPIRPVIQYSLDGKIVKVFKGGLQEAAAEYSINIEQCIGGRCKSSAGYVWRYEGDPFSYRERKALPFQRYVIELDKDGNEIRRFNSIHDAAVFYGISHHVFCKSTSIIGKGKLEGKFFVIEKQKCKMTHNPRRGPNPNLKGINARPVCQYSLDGDFIAEYKSMTEAEEKLHLNKHSASNISGCCKGKHKSAYGYVWKYAKEDKQ